MSLPPEDRITALEATSPGVDLNDLLATAAELNRVADVSTRLVSVTTTPLAVALATHEGKTIVLNKADGIAATLPAATGSGARYRIVVGTAASGGSYVISATGNDLFKGQALGDDGDGEPANGWATASNTNTITMDGSTRGGLVGDVWEFEDIAADVWAVLGFITQSGSEATPFSNV